MQFNRISDSDIHLINNKLISYDFGYNSDVAELHIFDSTGLPLKHIQNYNRYKPSPYFGLNDKYIQAIDIQPESDLREQGYTDGTYKLVYNFLRKISDKEFFVKSISSDRTEIIITSNTLENNEIETVFNKLKSNFEDYNFIKNYLLNFDKNELYLMVNIALDTNSEVYNIFVKLYTPLSKNISIKLLTSFCEEIIQTNEFEIKLLSEPTIGEKPHIQSANFDIDLDSKSSVSTNFFDTNTLLSNIGAKDSIQSLLKKTSIKLNINYEIFSEFCHYGNVEQRILNFIYKIKQIESYNLQLSQNLNNSITLQNKISNIVTNFDDYEYFLYTSKSLKSYPKNSDNSLKLLSSSSVISWLGDSSQDSNNSGILGEAKTFDIFNKDSLINNIPEYLIVDVRNKPFTIFCNMVGQHFDSIWIATNKFNKIYESTNNLNTGISPELVENVLKSFGVKLYNSVSNVDITNLPHKNYNKEIYKRILHNLPFLKKYKGTRNGIRQLINIFGVPDTLYRIYEYGSVKKGENLKEHGENTFNYTLSSGRLGYITVPYKAPNSSVIPKTFIFRLKLNKKLFGNTIIIGDFNNADLDYKDFKKANSVIDYSEPLFKIKLGNADYLTVCAETFDDTISSIFIKSNDGHFSKKIPANLYRNNWTTFCICRGYNSGTNMAKYTLTVGQNINNRIYKNTTVLEIPNELSSITAPIMNVVIGEGLDYSIQKLLIFSNELMDEHFDTHIFNASAISENTPFTDSLLCYIPFGTDLKTYNHGIITTLGSKINGSSYNANITFTGFEDRNNYTTNYEKVYYNSPNTVTTKRLTDKISISDKKYYGNVLSIFKQIEQKNDDYIDYKFLDVVFSPTFEQDNDIINRLSYFNIDDYVGDPLDQNKTEYQSLNQLKKIYLDKLIDKYNVKDYINIVNYIDNSLFKMIKDFVPISNNLSSGILIRQNLLNRNKIKGVSTIFQEFFINDIKFSGTSLSATSLNIEKDFNIYLKKDFDKKNYNKFLKTLTKSEKEEFRVSLFNQDINFLNSVFSYGSTTDIKNRYSGVKVFNKVLNEYNEGDVSLGKSLNVSSYVDKIGLFTNISNSDIFEKKCTIQVKYLVDKNGGLTDLNKLNRNIYDIQGLFKKDDTTIVNLFDNIKYSNQKSLDGDKKIFTSGFSYNPVLYFSNNDKYFKFNNLEETIPTYFRYIENKNRDITNIKNVYNLFPVKDIDISKGFVVGSDIDNSYSTFTIPESGQYEFNLDVSLNIRSINNLLSFKYTLSTYRNYISKDMIIDSISYAHQPPDTQYDSDGNIVIFTQLKPVNKFLEIPTNNVESMENFNWYWSHEKNSYNLTGLIIQYDVNRIWKLLESGVNKSSESYRIYESDDDFKYRTSQLYEVFDKNGNLEKLRDSYYDEYEETISLNIPVTDTTYGASKSTSASISYIDLKNRGIIVKDANIIKNGINNSYTKGEKIICVLQQIYSNDSTVNTIVLQNSSSIYSIKNNFNLKIGTHESLISSLSTNSLSISSKLNDYIGQGMFNLSGSELYKKYGDINDIFNLEIGDIVLLKDGKTKSNFYLEISKINVIGKNIVLSFLNELPSFILKENLIECIFINKTLDETNILINFNKKIGETSYGFLIPKNINPNFMNNIDIITKEVKQKLLNDYSLNKNSI